MVIQHIKTAASHQAALCVRGLTVSLPKGMERPHAVEDISFELARGQILCVVGESGSGKSVTGNGTPFGLAAYFYSSDVRRIWRVAEALEAGLVGIKEGALAAEAAPFGGVKESGYGREGSVHGLDDYMSLKYVCQGNLS